MDKEFPTDRVDPALPPLCNAEGEEGEGIGVGVLRLVDTAEAREMGTELLPLALTALEAGGRDGAALDLLSLAGAGKSARELEEAAEDFLGACIE